MNFFTRKLLKGGIFVAFIALLLQLWSADSSARGVSRDQPVKFAAMEAVFETKKNTPMTVIGIVDMKEEKVHGISVPSLLSLLTYHNLHEAVPGLNNFPKKDWPHIPSVFYSYRTMIGAWSIMMLVTFLGFFLLKRVEKHRWYLWACVFTVSMPYIANTAGWFTAEMGRQPWIVYNVMRTSQGISRVVHKSQVVGSLIMFTILYTIMGILFVYLLNKKIKKGPEFEEEETTNQYRDPFLELKK